MKKLLILFLLSILILSNSFSMERKILHTYEADYRLFPDTPYREKYIERLSDDYPVKYCVQSLMKRPRQDNKGYSCEEILKRLEQMGGVDKECFGVSYVDSNTGERKPVFKKAIYDEERGELYIKDKAAGGLHFTVGIDKYQNKGMIYVVNAIINKHPDNIFVRGLKKNEAEIFVYMEETEEFISVYALIQCSYSPVEHKFLKSYVEKAVNARVKELQNWFYRMLRG